MKKNGVLKALGIIFLIYVIFSWIIPTGYYSNGTYTSGTINPVGIFDLLKYPVITLTSSVFILTAICLLFIGGLYGVMKKTGLYSKLVDTICSKVGNNQEIFLIIITLVFALLSSLTGLLLPLFVVVPLIVGVLLVMGYSKLTAFLSTVGALLVGNMATTFGFNIAGYIRHFYNLDMNTGLLFKIILFALLVSSLIIFLLLMNKNTTLKKPSKEELLEIPYYEIDKNNKTKIGCSIAVMVIAFIVILVGMYNWFYGFDIDVFNNFYTAITKVEYNNLPIVNYILGNISAIGYWNNYELSIILLITTYIIGKIGKLSFSDIAEGFMNGMKKMLPVAVVAVLANSIFLIMNSTSNNSTMFATICNWFFSLSDKLQVVSISITSLIGGVLYNDFPYMINVVSAPVMSVYNNVSLVTFIQYAIHGLVQLIAPTSVFLVAGLTYLNIPYKEYVKSIWKFIVVALAIIMVLAFIMSVM